MDLQNSQDKFYILGYRDLSCHCLRHLFIEAVCLSSCHLCLRGTANWCVSWIRFVKRCGAQHDRGGPMEFTLDLTTVRDFDKGEVGRKHAWLPLGVLYFPNFSLTKKFVDHPFLGRRKAKGRGLPKRCKPLSALWLTSHRDCHSQEKDEGVSWSTQNAATYGAID